VELDVNRAILQVAQQIQRRRRRAWARFGTGAVVAEQERAAEFRRMEPLECRRRWGFVVGGSFIVGGGWFEVTQVAGAVADFERAAVRTAGLRPTFDAAPNNFVLYNQQL